MSSLIVFLLPLFYLGQIPSHVKADNHDMTYPINWCTISNAEFTKCNQMRTHFHLSNIKPRVNCVRGQSTTRCLALIQNRRADIITLDSGDLFAARRNVFPLMFEDYGKGDANYWVVAVAKTSNPNITFRNLKGKKSCHTGMCRTAGWKVPVASLVASRQILVTGNGTNILRDVGNFFASSCVPGALDPKYVPSGGASSPKLCQLCGGSGNNKCVRNNNEPYFGYAGAFRCLAEGGGEVAFVNHLTVSENSDGKNAAAWANNLKSSNYVLLCPNGNRRPLSSYQACNLAKVPSHVVALRQGARNASQVQEIIDALSKGQNLYGDDSNHHFRLFDSPAGSKDLLFRDATQRLRPVPPNLRNVRNWLANYLPVIRAQYNCK